MRRKLKRIHPTPDLVVCGDCLDPRHGLPILRSNSIDHTIMDPPYEAECHDDDKMWRLRGASAARTVERVRLGFDAMTEAQRMKVARHVVRVTRGWALVFCQDEGVPLWRHALLSAGAKWRRTCIWHKTDAMPKVLGDGPAQGHEAFVAVWCGEGKSVWNGGGRSNVWSVASGKNEYHDTEKPMRLMRDLVLNFTMPDDLILDPYSGGGSTLVAAKECGRHWLGFEAQEHHVETIRQRLDATRVRTQFEQMRMTSRAIRGAAVGLKKDKRKRGALDV